MQLGPVPGNWAAANASRPVAIVLYPFTPATAPDMAAALLLHHVAYHAQLGFAKVIQYTQARGTIAAPRPQAPGGKDRFYQCAPWARSAHV